MSGSCAVTWSVSKTSVVTVLLTGLERGDKIAIGHKLLSITFIYFRMFSGMCGLIESFANSISTAKLSANRNLDLTLKYPVVMWRYCFQKLGWFFVRCYKRCWALVFDKKGNISECTILKLGFLVLLCRAETVMTISKIDIYFNVVLVKTCRWNKFRRVVWVYLVASTTLFFGTLFLSCIHLWIDGFHAECCL